MNVKLIIRLLKMNLVFPIALIVLAVLSRFISIAPNFSPIISLALFSGAYLSNRKFAYLVPIAAMLISDTFLGFHYDMFAVYGSFALIIYLGSKINKVNVKSVLINSIAGAVFFFLVTNFSVWITSGMYSHDLKGLMTCYEMAIPFFRNTISSSIIYSAVMFGTYELSAKYIPSLSTSR